jgi:hypothetical protein
MEQTINQIKEIRKRMNLYSVEPEVQVSGNVFECAICGDLFEEDEISIVSFMDSPDDFITEAYCYSCDGRVVEGSYEYE